MTRKQKSIGRLISLLLCVVMLSNMLSLSVLATQKLTTQIVLPQETEKVEGSELLSNIGALYEVEEMRTPTEKHFRMPDGSYTAVKYGYEVHYREDGKYKEYDNTLVPAVVGGVDKLVPKDSGLNVAFSKNASDDNIFAIAEGDRKITFSIKGNDRKGDVLNKNAVATVVKKETAKLAELDSVDSNLKELEKKTNLSKVNSAVSYGSILPYTDIEYEMYGGNVKESIILSSPLAGNSWQFFISAEGLTAEKDSLGNIIFKDKTTEETAYHIPKGYMFDDNGVFSNDVEYTIAEAKGGYVLTVTASASWLSDAKRVYPVTVDPTLVKGGTNAAQVSDVYITEQYPTQNTNTYHMLVTGYDSNDGIYRILTKINSLPELTDTARVVGATYGLQQMKNNDGWYSYKGSQSKLNITVKKITEGWNVNTVDWENKPSFDNTVIDYFTVAPETATQILYFDITSAVQDWYKTPSDNHGIILQTQNESVVGSVGFVSSNNPHLVSTLPIYTVSYRDTKGLEDKWAYSSHSAGRAGEGHVNLYNGNLVFAHDDMSISGSIVPITISHVYNASQKGLQFTSSATNADAPITAAYNMNVGYGWKLSVCETIVQKELDGMTWLVYNDADGTELYFFDYNDGTTGNYVSEDGYNLTITIDSSSTTGRYILKDDYDNKKVFNSSGFITSISDMNGNRKTYEYSSGRLERIKHNPAGTTAYISRVSFYYNAAGALCMIENTLETTKYIEFYYSDTYNGEYSTEKSGYLRQIKYSSGDSSSYEYDANGALIKAKDNVDGTYIAYTYEENTGRISKVAERAETAYGQSLGFTYKDKKTTVQNSGKDDTRGTDDDINNVYLFDNHGRPICTYSTNNNGTVIYGASNAVYKSDEESKSNVRHTHKLETAAANGNFPNNLVSNSSFENGIWISSKSTGGTVEQSTNKAFLGTKSLKLTTAATTDYAHNYTLITVPETGKYTFSAYVSTSGVTSGTATQGGFNLAIGNVNSDIITGTTTALIQNGWQRISVTADLSAGALAQLYISLSNAKGTAYVDCVQFEKADAPSTYNMLDNGALESQNSWTSFTSASSYTGNGIDGKNTFIVYGTLDNLASASQTVNIGKPAANTSFVVSGWSKANAVAAQDASYSEGNPYYGHKTRYYALKVVLNFSDGTSETQYVDFNPNIKNEWQYVSGAIVAKEENSSKIISTATISPYYGYNCNFAYFDNISFTVEAAQVYTYDDKGNVKGIKSSDGNTDSMVYSDSSDLISQESTTGEKYTYTYYEDGNAEGVSKHKVKDVTSKAGVKASYEYNGYGCVTGTTITPTTGSLVISSSQTYLYYGNYLASVTDARGKTTLYNHNTATGLLNYVQNANSKRTSYIYDAAGKLTDIFADTDKDGVFDTSESGVNYTYTNKGRLTQIITKSTTYMFVYDSYGNISGIYIGNSNTPLVRYFYGANNGKLSLTRYADGTVISNTYDHLDRIVSVSVNDETQYTVTYNGNGEVSSYTDVETGRTYEYEYDSIGRLIRWSLKENGTTIIRSENQYDSVGRISKVSYSSPTMGGMGESYYYDANGRLSAFFLGLDGIGYSYDQFERINEKSFSRYEGITPHSHSVAYNFYTSGTNTSTLVSGMVYSYEDTIQKVVNYTYDNVGNITKITDGLTTKDYTYDDQNQMLSEAIYSAVTKVGTKTVYTYDKAGNILSKTVYDYNNGTLTNGVTTNYTYGNANWGDLLTAYDGETITYDANGNPLSYYNGQRYTFAWNNGRRLATANVGSNTVSYTYDYSGTRASKTVNGVLHNYYYCDNILLYEIWGDNRITYRYDESGMPYSMAYYNGSTTTTYYFITNLQGDIIELRLADNTCIAKYEYDAWGKLLKVTDSSGNEITDASHVGLINPIRYRGYYYDSETGLYYVSSRCYDPEIGRWISPEPNVDYGEFDEGAGLLSYNVYAYCANNPVNNFDPDGEAVANIVGGVIGGVAGAALGALLAKELGLSGWKKALFIAGVTAAGAALGAFLGPYMAKLGGKIASMTKSVASSFKATVQSARTAIKHSKAVTKLINNASKLKRSKTVMSHLSSRPYTNSTLTIQNIMKAGKPMADSSLKNGLKWVVNGTYNGSSGVWELVVDTTTNTIVHFLFRSK